MLTNCVPSATRHSFHMYLYFLFAVNHHQVKGIREPHEAKKKSFGLGGNRTHDLRIKSTVTLSTELRGRTEKVGDSTKPRFTSGSN